LVGVVCCLVRLADLVDSACPLVGLADSAHLVGSTCLFPRLVEGERRPAVEGEVLVLASLEEKDEKREDHEELQDQPGEKQPQQHQQGRQGDA